MSMAIFNSYVKLPEGRKSSETPCLIQGEATCHRLIGGSWARKFWVFFCGFYTFLAFLQASKYRTVAAIESPLLMPGVMQPPFLIMAVC